ncbi:aminotransferase class V-fold PLP-dependent enzyme [Mucilaginibacter sp. OK098]|uniref:aminotransferase class V-fold PLP-dependent enzyme n=1 Tax=Mucilaginibacter sp. OK098 TaxID=1855297 RepID=UPI0009118284|nr:aminotransferase class V-fold PLP-dependent enzyme [Mucilaginibacter sp. OK098]SHM78345.1 Selenocysteine lyase/Cysteine desulfurase [Mucilaginibacter sp. OK098]
MTSKSALENFFSAFRRNIIGYNQTFESPFGKKAIVYADWTASGRAYQPIEECLRKEIMPFVANTHTETTVTGKLMTKAYEAAKVIVKEHVHADDDDVLIFCGSGMTGAVNKLQRILGLRMQERLMDYVGNAPQINEELRPVVFVTHMEHHSNQVTWLETIATVEIIRADENGNVDLAHFRSLLEQFKHRKNKIAAVTGCSNVTGVQTPYHEIAKMIHEYGGLCFVDFACSAPYVNMDMHPKEKGAHLDAIYFSPHKFLGGPGTSGVLIFNKKVYNNTIPDQPGGGTIVYSNPWKVHEYIANIELREDGGTPPLLQGIKAAMCIRLKEEMGVKNIMLREKEILQIIFDRFSKMKNIEILEGNIKKRLGIVSFIVNGAHYNLIVKILNDRFGIQTRGGCSCAGTYGHMLLQVDETKSYEILNAIRSGDLLCKPGWIRLSVHPTMTNTEIDFIMDAIELTASHFQEWMKDYTYDPGSNEYLFNGMAREQDKVADWFNASLWNDPAALIFSDDALPGFATIRS